MDHKIDKYFPFGPVYVTEILNHGLDRKDNRCYLNVKKVGVRVGMMLKSHHLERKSHHSKRKGLETKESKESNYLVNKSRKVKGGRRK